jgi:hypothetical protein
MRLLAEHNPDVEFDWPRLLKEIPSEAAPRRDRDRDRDRDRRDRRDAPRPGGRPRTMDTSAIAVPPAPAADAVEDIQALAEAAVRRAEEHAAAAQAGAGSELDNGQRVVSDLPSRDVRRVADGDDDTDRAGHADRSWREPELRVSTEAAAADGPARVEPPRQDEMAEPAGPAAARLGADGLRRLRARYADLIARLGDKEMDAAERDELNRRAERLNPDAWGSAAEVTAALEEYEVVFESLRAVVGRHPRRRV